MRRRDAHLVASLWLTLAANVLALACVVFLTSRRLRAFGSRLDDLDARMAAAERTVANACGVALAAADAMSGAPASSNDADASAPPVVLGYGQTKTTRSRLLYRDLRYDDGHVEREYLDRKPLRGAGGQQAPR